MLRSQSKSAENPTISKSALDTPSKATRAAANTKAAYRPSTNACVDPVTTAGIVTIIRIAHQVPDDVRPARLAIDAELRSRARKVVKFRSSKVLKTAIHRRSFLWQTASPQFAA